MDMTTSSTFLLLLLQQPSGGGGIFNLFLPMIVVFVIFYFLIIRPQQKRQRQAQQEREKMLNDLKPGDKVVTTGGIFGTIVTIKGDNVQLRIAQSVSIEVLRSAIAGPRGTEVKEAEVVK
ncbi:MAG: preprotein translocase subunit YajC [Blastocatellia bacterium]|nr:preprotein translocase subunit YajC [Blastocatellia bacterium]